MIVTALEPVGKTRVQVFLDGEKAFVLYRNEAYRMGIREGESLSEQAYAEIMQEILPKRARLRCMNILKSADKTEWQLRTKLRQGGYPKEIEDIAIEYVRSFLDGEKAFVLYRNEAYRMGIREGESLSEQAYAEIMQEILPKRARLRCMNILKSADKTEWQLRTKLRQGGYPKEIEDIAIEYVRSFHYIDDVRYAGYYIESRSQTKSKRQIVQELKAKGVSSEDIEAAYEQAEGNSEEETILALAKKKRMNLENPTAEEQQKYYAFFMRKGFSYAAVRKVLRGLE